MLDAGRGDDATPPLGPGISSATLIGGVEGDSGFKRRPGYEKARDQLLGQFVQQGHQPELWRAVSLQAEWSGEVTIVRCPSCRYAVTVNPTLPRLTRYRGGNCSGQFAAQVLEDQQRAAASDRKARRAMLAIVMAMPVLIAGLITATVIVTGEFKPVFLVPIAFWSLGAWGAWKQYGEDSATD